MIIVDTGVLVALLDADDQHHRRCRDWYADARGPLIVPAPVLVETCYFIERDASPELEATFLRSFEHDRPLSGEEEPFILAQIDPADLAWMAELVEQYADLRLGVVDASVIAVAERLKVSEVATLDRRHFTVVRPGHVSTFNIVPESPS